MDDPLVHCPFDMAHMCKQSRFQKHLIKCRNNHPESKLEPCPYNATEYIHPDDLIEHLKVCTKAKFLEGQKYTAERLKENYLDAPFHIPKPKVETEDFENEEIHLGFEDEQVLERSVSQMSVNSIASAKSYGKSCDDTMSNSKSATSPSVSNRISLELGSRSSTLRSVGRGYAMAGLISVLQQIDEMDYAKYEIRSTVSENKIRSTVSENKPKPDDEEDPDFAPLSKFGVRQGNISLFEKHAEQDKSNFEDCSSDEELEASDNASDCSSESTIIENGREHQATPKLSDCPNFVCDSDDDDYPKVDGNDSAITSNAASRCPSTLSQSSISNERESSSSRSSFLSLMARNKMENAFIVRKMEGFDERNFLRGKRGWNHSSSNRDRYCEQAGGPRPFNAGFKGSTNSSFSPVSFSNKGGPQRYPQNKQSNYQNYHNQEQFSHANRHTKSINFDQSRGKVSFNQVNSNSRGYNQIGAFGDGNSFRANSAGRGNLLNHHSVNKGNYNQGDAVVNKGSFNKQNSVGRGNLFNQGDCRENSVGRGNLFNQGDSYNKTNFVGNGNVFNQGDKCYQENSVGRGNVLNQGNLFSQKNSVGRGGFYSQGDTHFQETPVGRGNILNQANLFSQENFVGRGKLNDQANSSGKGYNNQNNSTGRGSFQNHLQSFGRGGLFQIPGSNIGQGTSVGRGNILARLISQNPQYQDRIKQNGSITNSFVGPENFRD